MMETTDNKLRPRPTAARVAKSWPRLSLNLHTMPQTDGGHWQKWLLLGILILGLIVLAAYFLFS